LRRLVGGLPGGRERRAAFRALIERGKRSREWRTKEKRAVMEGCKTETLEG
jgi:hypothetical protein